jgi:hypothetical protein
VSTAPAVRADALLGRVADSTVGARALGTTRVVVAAAALLQLGVSAPNAAGLADQPFPLPLAGVPAGLWGPALLVWAVAACALLVGWAVPVSGALLAASAGYLLVLDERMYSNNLMLLVVLAALVAATGGGRLRARPGERRSGAAAFLLLTQLSTVYVFAGLSKLTASFLAGDVIREHIGVDGAPLSFSVDAAPPLLLSAAAAGAVVFEVGLGIALWVPRLRPWAFAAGAAMHAGFVLTMTRTLSLTCFGLLSLAVYPLFASWRLGTADRDGAPG